MERMEGTETEIERVEAICCEIRDQLAQQDTEALKRSAEQLLKVSKPQNTMDLLAPLLFRDSSATSFTLSSQEALSVVGFLLAKDDSSYLKPAARAVRNEAVRLTTSEHPMVVSPELLNVMVAQLNGSDIEASTNATEAIVACCRKLGPSFADPTMNVITDSWRQARGRLTTNRKEASTICVRCASSVVEMVLIDDSVMKLALSTGANDLLLAMMTDDSDPLVQMSTLDLIEKLAGTQPMHHERAQWLFTDALLQPLLQLAGGNVDGYPDPILGGPALRVVAALCKLGHRDATFFGLASNGELLTGFHRALHNFEGSGELDRLALVDAISSFSSASLEALDLVLNDPVTREAWLFLSVAQPKMKGVVLFSVAMVLDPADEVDANGDSIPLAAPSNAMGMKLYSTLGRTNDQEATELVLSLARSPFPEVRLGAYALLKAVAKLPTGGQVLFANGGFYEFLITREGESTKEGREAKYGIVEAIMDSEVKGLLANTIVEKLERYLKEGPHYVKPLQWEVATD